MKTSCCKSSNYHVTESGPVCLNIDCENYLAETSVHHDYGKWKNQVSVLLFGFLLMFSVDDFSMENKEQKLIYVPQLKEAPLTVENLHAELISQNVLCPEHVLAQIRIESGNLTSFLLKRTNNMLGMRYPGSRKTTACGVYIPAKDTVVYGSREELKKYMKMDNYAVYTSWKDAVADYKLWQEQNFNVTDRYLTFLGKVYAEDTQYVKKIKQMAGQE